MERKVRKRRGKKAARTKKGQHIGATAIAIVLLLVVGTALCCLLPFSAKSTTNFIYVGTTDTTLAAVCAQTDTIATLPARAGFRLMATLTGYAKHPRQGRYAAAPGETALAVFRRMRNGTQAPISLVIPSVRTKQRLAAYLGERLMVDSTAISRALSDTALCSAYGHDTLTILCLFIPNTYEVFWDIEPDQLLARMEKESRHFWRGERAQRAHGLRLTTTEVSILASIVEEETNNAAEKPLVAGMYYNRLQAGMPLQADPTIKFALGDFSLRRIWHSMLTVDSPYNTYINTGLPPGPIRIPTIESIDAVIHLEHHNFLYMCAKEDFSGTHNFAATYSEHLKNARRYSEALNNRGLKR